MIKCRLIWQSRWLCICLRLIASWCWCRCSCRSTLHSTLPFLLRPWCPLLLSLLGLFIPRSICLECCSLLCKQGLSFGGLICWSGPWLLGFWPWLMHLSSRSATSCWCSSNSKAVGRLLTPWRRGRVCLWCLCIWLPSFSCSVHWNKSSWSSMAP